MARRVDLPKTNMKDTPLQLLLWNVHAPVLLLIIRSSTFLIVFNFRLWFISKFEVGVHYPAQRLFVRFAVLRQVWHQNLLTGFDARPKHERRNWQLLCLPWLASALAMLVLLLYGLRA